jgi:peptidoglycan/LPS O-acetylase OafA/YrhL
MANHFVIRFQKHRQPKRRLLRTSRIVMQAVPIYKGIISKMTSNARGSSEIQYRADIDGLRAIAVLSVIAFHANYSLLPGGFIGVDVFFVISGFLISSLILTQVKQGSFTYMDFYERRIRRIFPALVIVLLAVWAIGWFTLVPSEFSALGTQISAGASFAGNIITYAEVGYFDPPASTKPLLHLWSLGVEEQFYIVFPALLASIWLWPRARLILALIGIASFLLNVIFISHHPALVFYLPMTRFWEFIAGALLAYAPLAKVGFDQRMLFGPLVLARRDIASTIGLILLFGGFGVVVPDSIFPGWWALLPVFGTVLLISAGQKAWINSKLLANPTLVFVGLISYPLYLWHWPLIVFCQSLMSDINPAHDSKRVAALVGVGLSVILAWLTYHYIERPIRERRQFISVRSIAIANAVCLICVALLGLTTARTQGLPGRYPREIRNFLAPLVVAADYPENTESENHAGPLLIVYGDSHAGHLIPGLHRLQNEQAFHYKLIGWGECAPVADIKPADEEKCRRFKPLIEQEFARLKPDIVMVAALWLQYGHIERIAETLKFFKQIGIRRIIVIGEVPYWPSAPQKMLIAAYLSDSLHRIPKRLLGFNQEALKIDRRLKEIAEGLGVTFISASTTLCDESGCLIRVGDNATDIVQADASHFSAIGSWYFIQHIASHIF